tara:strand:+ start:1035 stop:1586 length:552 start_codon:yes stop_codon:yes gene_type:complete
MTKNLNDLEKIFLKGEDLRKSGNLNEAIKLFREILEESPNNSPTLNSIANCYFQLNDLVSAEKFYLECLKINKNILTLNNLSLLYLKKNNLEKALPILKESLNQQSSQESVVEKIAYCLTELSFNKEADIFCEKFIKIYPHNKIILSYYRRTKFNIGNHQEGLRAYKKETGVIEMDDDKVSIE